MNGYLDRNISAAGPKFGGFPSGTAEHSQPSLSITLSRSGLPVPRIAREGREFPLHSLFDPAKEGEKLRKNYPDRGMKIFYGLAGGYQIRPFLNRSAILIIEPDPAVLRTLLSQMDFTDILSCEKVYLLCRPERETLSDCLKSIYIPLLEGDFHFIPHRFYRGDGLLDEYHGLIGDILDEISADCSTQRRLGRQWQRNIIRTAAMAAGAPFDPSSFAGYREAVLTAAGPGLEKEMDRLAELRPGTLLVTVDTALPSLLGKGIIPDAVITIDPQAIGYLHFMDPPPPPCRIIADWGTPVPPTVDAARISWFSSSHPLCLYLMERGGFSLFPVDGGGNVTQAALALLRMSGVERVTLLGADFSYPGGKPYCRGSYFTDWYACRSDRLDSLENGLTRFVLERSKGEGTGESRIYSSLLMDGYSRDFIESVRTMGGRTEGGENGKWLISWESSPVRVASFPDSSPIPDILGEYGLALENFLSSPDAISPSVKATLIPLGYSFYRESGEEALRKSAQYTLNLINRGNSLKKTYTSL